MFKSSEFSHNGSILNDTKSIANVLNGCFLNIGPTLASKIPQLGIDYRNSMPYQNNMLLFLSPTDESEVKKNILHLKDGASGKDEIMSQAIKCISDDTAAPLTRQITYPSRKVCFPVNRNLIWCHLCTKLKVQWFSVTIDQFLYSHGPLIRYVKLQFVHSLGMQGTFLPPFKENR